MLRRCHQRHERRRAVRGFATGALSRRAAPVSAPAACRSGSIARADAARRRSPSQPQPAASRPTASGSPSSPRKVEIRPLDRRPRARQSLAADHGDVADPTWSADSLRVAYDRTAPRSERRRLAAGAPTAAAKSRWSAGRRSSPSRVRSRPTAATVDHTLPGTSNSDVWIRSLARRPRAAGGRGDRGAGVQRPLLPRRQVARLPRPLRGARSSTSGPSPPAAAGGRSRPAAQPNRTGRRTAELFFRNADALPRRGHRFGAAPSSPRAPSAAGVERPRRQSAPYSPAPDGKRFAALPGYETSETAVQVNLALHWDREVRRLLKLDR